MRIYVNYENRAWKRYKIDFSKIARAAAHAAGANRDARISITLTDDASIQKLNREYRDIDKPTNVLSFELGDATLLGDIFISLDTVKREAADQKISVHDHTAHMVVHGVLHLMGYDHIKDVDAARMESKEIAVLKKLKIKNPYADDMPRAAVRACAAQCPGTWLNRIKVPTNGVGRYVMYALFGMMAAFGFAPFNCAIATVAGIAGAYWLTTRDGRRVSVWRDLLHVAPFGAAYAVAMFWWTLNSIYVVPELARQFAIWTIPAILGIGIAGAIIFGLPFVALRRINPGRAASPFVFAGAWTTVLWLREWAFTGFPWNPVANTALPWLGLANSMSLWGALGLTFVIVGATAGAVELLRMRGRGGRTTFGVFVLLIIVGAMYGHYNIRVANYGANSANAVIRIVQPAQSQSQKMSYSREDARRRANDNLRTLVELAATDIGAVRPDLIVFPETTYPFVVNDGQMPLGAVFNTNVIVGSMTYADGKVYNSMIVGDATGNVTNVYSKTHLVPFGEYSPLGMMPSPADLARGTGAELMSVNLNGTDFVFAPAICYEIIFSDALVPNAGVTPNAIINITNDTWFGATPGTYQHLDMVRRYAIESGLPIIRANYSGISAFVAPNGAVISQLPIGATGVLDGAVWGAHETPYRIIGRDGWMIIILLFACIGAISMSISDTRK